MKKNLLLFVLAISAISYSQIPTYYNDVNLSLSGQALKNELATKVTNTHTTLLSYTPGVWDALKQTDLDPTDPSKVLLIYGWNDSDGDITNDRTRGVNENGGGTGVWNREHVFSKSLANPNLGTEGAGADAHNLRPCDAQRNSSRSNRKFAAGSGNSGITPQGHWYPGDEWKGDVARMMMYMYIRYGDRTLPINVGVGNPVSGDTNMIDLFLQWNAEDPVSDLEKQRNPILEGLQGNRNPFIDNPAFATQVWGGPQAEDLFGTVGGGDDMIAPSIPNGLVATNTTVTSTQLSWNTSSDNVGVTAYELYQNGVFLITVSSTNHTVSGLAANTTYAFTVLAKDAAGNSSATSTALNVTTLDTSAGGNATELFFSEYIEGSSYNKALEIANYTGGSVNLSAYSIKKQTNGAGSWSSALNLTGNLINGDVHIVANSSASTAIQNEADVVTGSSSATFNGNDAVGLFKNDVLIDIIGTFNGGTANFAKDVTLVRKSTITMPSTIYAVAEWDSFPKDTFSDLGTHTFDGGVVTPDTQAPTAPANLLATNVTVNSADLSWTASTDNVGVTAYDVYQNGALLTSTTTTNYSATGLTAATSYAFTVIAKDAAGNESLASNTANVTTATPADTEAPTAPASLVATNVTVNSADLSWTASTDNVGVTAYDVYQDGVLLTSTTTTNYSATGLIEATSYAFTVIAKDAAGNESLASNTANVTTATPVDTQAPTIPANLVANNITQSTIDLNWTASTDNVGVTSYNVFQDGTFLATTSSTNFSVTGLAVATPYTFDVIAYDAANNASPTASIAATTLDNVLVYCNSRGNNVNYEFIDYVGLGGIANASSANGGYGDFTSQIGNLPYGSNTIVLSIGFVGSSYTENWAVWIDYNQNGTFESSEQVVTGSTSSSGNLSYNFTVPTSALSGATRMRVAMKWNGASSACETFSYGEVEDYTVNIGAAAARSSGASVKIDGELGFEEPIFAASLYPNPATQYTTIELRDDRQASFRLINVMGQVVKTNTVTRNRIPLDGLTSGMYIIEINDGQRAIKQKLMIK